MNDAGRRFHRHAVEVLRRVMEACISCQHAFSVPRCSASVHVCSERRHRHARSAGCVHSAHSRERDVAVSSEIRERTLTIKSRLTMSCRHGSVYRRGMRE